MNSQPPNRNSVKDKIQQWERKSITSEVSAKHTPAKKNQ